jgi:membrane protein DedA with SNARE-associated domain
MIELSIIDSLNAGFLFQYFVEHANYWFVFIFMAIESSFIPFPSEVVVPPAAYLAMQSGSDLNIYAVCLVATAGAICGSLINYYIALWIGRPIVYAFAGSRFGHICLLNEQKVQNAEAYFDKHGAISTFVGRLIPAVRQLISIPAGLARMNVGKFVAFTALGALAWNIVLTWLGYFLSTFVTIEQLYAKVEEYNAYLTYAGAAIACVCVVFILWHVFRPKHDTIETLN